MLKFFKRKQCKQCGWELKLFTKLDYCSVECQKTHIQIMKESKGE
jgi:hypothetical protein